MPKQVTAEVILAAKSGDNDALVMIARYFQPYITKVSTRPFYDEYGKQYDFVDEELRKHIESRLMFQIVYSFDPYRLPYGEEMPKD